MKLNHSNVSFAKSVLRIGAAAALIVSELQIAGVLFCVAELLGILEEIV
jgi:hypothetical protein